MTIKNIIKLLTNWIIKIIRKQMLLMQLWPHVGSE